MNHTSQNRTQFAANINTEHIQWFKIVQKLDADHHITNMFKATKNPYYFPIFSYVIQSEDRFIEFWNQEFSKLTNNLKSELEKQKLSFDEKTIETNCQHVLLRLRQILYDKYVTDHILFGHEFRKHRPTTTNLLNGIFSEQLEYEEYHTLEMDAELLQKYKDVKSDTLENIQELKDKKLIYMLGVQNVMIKKVPEPKPKVEKKKIRHDRPWAYTEDERLNLLYEHLYKIWVTISEQEDAWPFEKPVETSEAPDYYDVIKNPMDMSTIMNKLKNLKYPNKQAFKADFDLMFTNCKHYNGKGTFYWKAADTLHTLVKRLISKVPDTFVIKPKEPPKPKPPKIELIPMKTKEDEELERKIEQQLLKLVKEKKEKIKKELDSVDPFDRDQRWSILTEYERLPILKRREEQSKLKFSDREALLRTSDAMSAYYLYDNNIGIEIKPKPKMQEVKTEKSEDKMEIDTPTQKENEKKQESTSDKKDAANSQTTSATSNSLDVEFTVTDRRSEGFFPEYSHIMGCIPDLPFSKWHDPQFEQGGALDLSKLKKKPKTSPKKEERTFSLGEDFGLIYQNVNKLFELKSLVFKEPWTRPIASKQKIQVNDYETSHRILRCMIALFAAHEGFEEIYEQALELFTDVVEAYFLKLGKILNTRLYMNTSTTSFNDNLICCLREMGIPDIKKVKEQQNAKIQLMSTRLQKIEERLRMQGSIIESSLPQHDNQPKPEDSQTTKQDVSETGDSDAMVTQTIPSASESSNLQTPSQSTQQKVEDIEMADAETTSSATAEVPQTQQQAVTTPQAQKPEPQATPQPATQQVEAPQPQKSPEPQQSSPKTQTPTETTTKRKRGRPPKNKRGRPKSAKKK